MIGNDAHRRQPYARFAEDRDLVPQRVAHHVSAHVGEDLDFFDRLKASPRCADIDSGVEYMGELPLLLRRLEEVRPHNGAEGIFETRRASATACKGLVVLRPDEHHEVRVYGDAPGRQGRGGFVGPLDSAHGTFHHGPFDAGLFQHPGHLLGRHPGLCAGERRVRPTSRAWAVRHTGWSAMRSSLKGAERP